MVVGPFGWAWRGGRESWRCEGEGEGARREEDGGSWEEREDERGGMVVFLWSCSMIMMGLASWGQSYNWWKLDVGILRKSDLLT